MRIAYVTPHYAPFVGGVESHALQIARRAAKLGHDVTVLTQKETRQQRHHELIDGVAVRRFTVPVPSTNYALSPSLWLYLGRFGSRYDVVHAHAYHALPALAAAVTKRSALVFTPHYHGTGHSRFRKLLHPPYRTAGGLIFARADRVIAVSPPEAELILRHFPAVGERLVVIPNGVDQQALMDAQPFAEPRTVVLSAGRIEAYKQVDKTVAAVAHLPDDFVLRVTGDGAGRAAAEAVARESGVGERVQFLGRVPEDDLYRWFRTAAVYVSMSSNEAMPVTLIESLAAGARIVASDIPAHRDLVTKTGGAITLVPIEADASALAKAIVESSRAPRAAATVDTWDDVAEATVAVYRDAIASHG